MDRALKPRLEARFGDRLTGPVRQRHDETEIRIAPGDVPDVLRALHDEPEFRFQLLSDLAGVDTGEAMQVVYHLWSDTTADWLRVIADGLSRDDPRVPSVTFLWKGAEWMEREAYDMFGITFEGNRDLRRIYMPPDYTSFPLRKDFFLPDDASRSPGGGVRHMEQTHAPAERRPRRPRPPGDQRGEPDDDRDRIAARHPRPRLVGRPAGHPRRAARRRSSRSRRIRRGRSARPSSTPSATARCSSTWGPSTRRPTASCGSSSRSTARRSSTSTRSSATSIAGVEKLCENADYHQAICYIGPARVHQLAVLRVVAGDGVREAPRRPGARGGPSTSGSSPAS